MAGKTRKTPPSAAPGAGEDQQADGPSPGRGNAFAQTLLRDRQEGAPQDGGLGFGDSIAALRGELHLRSLLPAGVEAEFATGDNEANELDYDKAWFGGNDSVSIDRVRINSLTAGGMSVENLNADNILLAEQSAPKGSDAGRLTIPTASAKNISADGLTVASAEVSGVQADRQYAETDAGWASGFFSTPGDSTATVEQVTLSGVVSGDGQAERLSAAGVSGSLTPGKSDTPQLTVGAERLTAAGLAADGLTVRQASASDISASAHATSPESVALTGQTGAVRADGVGYTSGGVSASAGTLSAEGLTVSEESIEASGLTAEDVKARYQAGAGGQGSADLSVLDELFDLVQHAQVRGAVPLNAGRHGRGKSQINVPQGAQAVVELTVAGNRIVPQRTSVNFTPDLGTRLWPKLNGIYITNNGRVFVDVRKSLFIGDQDLLELLGMGTNRALPLELGDAAQALAGAGGGGGNSSHADLANVAGSRFTGSATLSGTAAVGDATVDVGSANVAAAVEGGDRIGARITDLVLKSVGLKTEGTSIQVSQIQSEQIDAQHSPAGGNLSSKKITAGAAKVSR